MLGQVFSNPQFSHLGNGEKDASFEGYTCKEGSECESPIKKNHRLLSPCFLSAELAAGCPPQPSPSPGVQNEAHSAEDLEGEVEVWTWA